MIKGLVIFHLLSVVAVFISELALAYKVILWDAIIVSLLFYLGKHFAHKGQYIRYSSRNGWELDQAFYPIEILTSTVITSYLLILHFEQQNKRKQTILICKDALINDDYRKLIVALRLSGLKKDAL